MDRSDSDARSIPFTRSLAGRLLLLGILPGAAVLGGIIVTLMRIFQEVQRITPFIWQELPSTVAPTLKRISFMYIRK